MPLLVHTISPPSAPPHLFVNELLHLETDPPARRHRLLPSDINPPPRSRVQRITTSSCSRSRPRTSTTSHQKPQSRQRRNLTIHIRPCRRRSWPWQDSVKDSQEALEWEGRCGQESTWRTPGFSAGSAEGGECAVGRGGCGGRGGF